MIVPLVGPRAWERLWSNVNVIEPEECWVWVGKRAGLELPRFNYLVAGKRHRRTARHAVFHQLYGPVPKDAAVFTKCHNVICMNPEHFFVAPKGFHTGEQMTGSFMSFEKAREMRQTKAVNPSFSYRTLARMWDVATGTAFKICKNQIWCENRWPSPASTPTMSSTSTNSEETQPENKDGMNPSGT